MRLDSSDASASGRERAYAASANAPAAQTPSGIEPAKANDGTGAPKLPHHRDLYYDGDWHVPDGGYADTFNPATGENLGTSTLPYDLGSATVSEVNSKD